MNLCPDRQRIRGVGHPKEKPAFDYMITYSPYDNIEAKTVSNMLVRTSFNDSQVCTGSPPSMSPRCAPSNRPQYCNPKDNMNPAGHAAPPAYDRLHETALITHIPDADGNSELTAALPCAITVR